MQEKIHSYRDLRVWQKAHELVLLTYQLTKQLPPDEQFGLTSQMRRAAVSITANIAEGFGRYSVKDREHFYVMSSGSLLELDSHYQAAFDIGYIGRQEYESALDLIDQTGKLLGAFLKAHRSRASKL